MFCQLTNWLSCFQYFGIFRDNLETLQDVGSFIAFYYEISFKQNNTRKRCVVFRSLSDNHGYHFPSSDVQLCVQVHFISLCM